MPMMGQPASSLPCVYGLLALACPNKDYFKMILLSIMQNDHVRKVESCHIDYIAPNCHGHGERQMTGSIHRYVACCFDVIAST